MLSQIAYVSTAVSLDITPDVEQILTASRRHNEKAGVTGLLLFAQGTYLQTLEGDKQDIDRVFKKIHADPRHSNITVLLETTIETRRFANWAMGWSRIPSDHPHAAEIARLGRRSTHDIQEDGSSVDALLDSFFHMT